MSRRRLAVAIVLALTGAGLADRFAPAAAPLPAADVPAEPGGVWACPFLKAATAPGWIHLANAGEAASKVRITYVIDGKPPAGQVVQVAAGRATTVAAPASIKGPAGAIVEYAGGEIIASHTAIVGAAGESGGTASMCSRPGPQTLVAGQGSTFGVDTQLYLLNPGTADAVVDVSLLVDGLEVQPEALRGRVIPARGRLIVREGDFAFDERAVAAMIRARSGRVVAETLLTGHRLFELVPAVPAVRDVAVVGTNARGVMVFSTVSIGDEDAVTDARLLSSAGQGSYSPLAGGLAPNTPKVAGPPEGAAPAGPVALAVTSTTSPVVVGARWQVTSTSGLVETAASVGVPPSIRAITLLGPPALTSSLRLLVANPGETDGILSVTLLTDRGVVQPSGLQSVPLGAGKATRINLTGGPTSGTVGIILTATQPIVAALEAITTGRNFLGAYAVTAVPDLARGPVSVTPDARAGVPA